MTTVPYKPAPAPLRRVTTFSVLGAHHAGRTVRELLDKADRDNLDQLWLHGWPTPPELGELGDWTVNWRAGDWWIRAYKPGGKDRNIAIPALNTDAGRWESWEEAETAEALHTALLLYVNAMGQLPQRSPGSTAHRLLRSLHTGKNAKPIPLTEPMPSHIKGATPPLIWEAPDAAHRLSSNLYLHSYDKNGMYLATCSSLALPVGSPAFVNGGAIPALLAGRLPPGYWHGFLHPPAGRYVAELPVIDPGPKRGGWYPTPTVALAREWGYQLDIAEAFIWHDTARPLEPWYKHLRSARTALIKAEEEEPAARIARAAVKSVYTQGMGWFAATAGKPGEPGYWDRSQDPLYKPFWLDLIIAQARANLLRNWLWPAEAGHHPIAAQVDCLYYASDNPDPRTAIGGLLPLGRNLGQFSIKDSCVPAADALAAATPRGVFELHQLTRWLNERAGR